MVGAATQCRAGQIKQKYTPVRTAIHRQLRCVIYESDYQENDCQDNEDEKQRATDAGAHSRQTPCAHGIGDQRDDEKDNGEIHKRRKASSLCKQPSGNGGKHGELPERRFWTAP
jgi:hypothetical protein